MTRDHSSCSGNQACLRGRQAQRGAPAVHLHLSQPREQSDRRCRDRCACRGDQACLRGRQRGAGSVPGAVLSPQEQHRGCWHDRLRPGHQARQCGRQRGPAYLHRPSLWVATQPARRLSRQLKMPSRPVSERWCAGIPRKVMVDTKHERHPHLVTACKKLSIEIA